MTVRAFAALALLVPQVVHAAEQVERTRDGTVVRAELDRDAIALADELVLTLSIEGATPLEVEPIKAVTAAKTWIVSPRSGPETTTLAGGRSRWQQSFRLAPLAAGDVPLPLQPIRVRAGSADAVTVALKPFSVQVSSTVPGPSLSALKDITPLEELPEEPSVPWRRLARLGMTACAAILALVFLRRRRQRQQAAPTVELPPDQWALRELERLEALALPPAGAVERYHTLLADVVRRYLDRRFGLHAQEQTTEEFLAKLQQVPRLQPEHQERLKALFERCDLAKYAGAAFSADECRATTLLAREFVTKSAQDLAQPAQDLQPVT